MPYPSSFSTFTDLVAEEKYCSVYNDDNSLSNECAAEVEVIHTSEFSAGECGDPMFSQHLSIDFTPVPGVDDNSILVKKCMDFWAFVKQEPQLRNFMVEPMEENVPAESLSSVSQPPMDIATPPAVQWLEKEAGQPTAFVDKPQEKYCDTHGLEDITTIENAPPKTDLLKHSRENLSKGGIMRREISRSQPGVVDMCKKLQEWDSRNPKSMDPPGPVPTLVYSKMQRNRD